MSDPSQAGHEHQNPQEAPGARSVPPRPAVPPQAPSVPNAVRGEAGTDADGSADASSSWNATRPLPSTSGYGSPYGAPAAGAGYGSSQYAPSQGGYQAAGYEGYAAPAETGSGTPRRKEPKRFGAPVLIAGMLAAALVGGGSAVGANYLLAGGQVQAAATAAANGEAVVINNPENVTAVTAAAAKATPSVVTIEVSDGSQGGSGSGIILDDDGHILTNTHVVTLGGATASPDVAVRTADGKVHSASIVGTDPLSDLAVIKIDAEGLTPASLGSSSALNVGDTAIAIGAPLGLSGTVTDGIVSKLNRTISVASSAVPESTGAEEGGDGGDQFNFQFPGEGQQQSSGTGSIYINVIQTDAAINHGNSGGALVDVEGNIIGVNVAIASSGSSSSGSDSGSIGVGFAIPIDYAQRIAQDLINEGKATHGLLGVTVSAQPADTGNSQTSFSVGAAVREVTEGSPAADAGLRPGDVITGVGDRVVEDSNSLTAVVREYAAGDTATVRFTRGGQEQEADVVVGQTPAG
ncbi:S1C family serine protease [Zafaria sp. Z1313]|uniref:S1C family serine protease n=1 Tax=unclassified Zafaria TaxID=2828765 RepID=UPI002E77332F|nr:trypsin-like peptidase domain-containing protein [Zafaria sp. J156]MEE1620338.1 trypsin-like peptidase domain-containing protein [Zafaria sp. J156]